MGVAVTAAGAPSVAVIGLGFGRAHVPAFQAAGARVVAVCQRDEAAARKVATAYGVPHAYARWEDLLAAQHPDVVVVATPPHLHRAIVGAAVSGGSHVLCEKPLATSREDAEGIVADVARGRRVGMTGFNWRFTAAMQKMRALMADGAVGRILHIRGHWLGARWADEASPTTWRMDRHQAGHGAMGDMGVHLVDLVRWTCGSEFARVAAHAGIAYPAKPVAGTTKPTDAEDFVSLVAELASGAQVSLVASRGARAERPRARDFRHARRALLQPDARRLSLVWRYVVEGLGRRRLHTSPRRDVVRRRQRPDGRDRASDHRAARRGAPDSAAR